MGDFNYPNIKWDSESTESNTVEEKCIENIGDNFLFQHITMPTRGRLGNKSNILDLILTNEEGMIEDLTRFNKIAIQGTPQMAVDKEAICLSRVYSYYPKCNFPLFYV